MIIEYTVSASGEIQGNGWIAYRRHKSGAALIFDEYWGWLRLNAILEYHQLYDSLIDLKKRAKSRAFSWLSKETNGIYICQYGVIPIIWIIEENKHP